MLSTNLSLLRKEYNLTQDDIAKTVYVSRQAVSKWERGESVLDLHALIVLAKMYNVTIDDLISSKDIKSANKATEINQTKTTYDVVKIHKTELLKQMLIWILCLFGIYSLICGIIQTALFSILHEIWLIWFTLPIVPPLIFALRFKNYISKKWLMFFVDMPFISGIVFVLIQSTNRDGAWIAFLLIPAYYAIALIVFVHYRKKERANTKNSSEIANID